MKPWEIVHGDCVEVMAAMPENSVDTILTDPPYGLEFMGKEWDSFGRQRPYAEREGYANAGILPHYGRGGKPEDRDRFKRKANHEFQAWSETWCRAAHRVLKPGGFLLAFSGTRTWHRLACAIEDAGFELRDTCMWLYGSGFPKSLNIAKALDARAKTGSSRPEDIRRAAMGEGYKPSGRGRVNYDHGGGSVMNGATAEHEPQTDIARQFDGWGTALKPAWEPILVAMKACDGTYAQNAERHGVAGLNIDGARIPITEKWDGGGPTKPRDGGIGYASSSSSSSSHDLGRWPANLLLDESAAELLDAQSGELTSNSGNLTHKAGVQRSTFGKYGACETRGISDSGGASRFFYTAKASRSERNIGDVDNKHPTVKPLDLMVYLCKLTATPTGGVILDPFCGSGTTGVAALRVGRPFIGIEQDAESVATARGRMGGDAPLFNVMTEARA